ncbi:Hypothetical predicted protein [Mytilus galloprovincialis]|uniref:Uncharacterized protein n=1 Tax=Mytilus galloprovincialis TaxID=29158 RepID=A0A8B6CFC3_MYTGA|nr:Hypothetical predicted protein [Mytilus galloprovincialis]
MPVAQRNHTSTEKETEASAKLKSTNNATPTKHTYEYAKAGVNHTFVPGPESSSTGQDSCRSFLCQAALAGDVDRKIKATRTIIYAIGKDRFGVEEQKKGKSQAMKENRRVGEIAKLRREQRNLTNCFKKAELHQQKALKKLRDVNRNRI